MAESIVFWVVAPISLGAALAVVLLRNPVHAALMLVLNFFTIAVFYAVLEAQFLAVTQIIVYAGAVMVLFLFVLMLLAMERDEPDDGRLRGQRPMAVVFGVILFAVLAVGVAGPFLGGEDACPTNLSPQRAAELAGTCAGLAEVNEPGNVRAVGMRLFTDYVWPFEVTSVLLIIAVIGAMVLGRREEQRSPAQRAAAARQALDQLDEAESDAGETEGQQ